MCPSAETFSSQLHELSIRRPEVPRCIQRAHRPAIGRGPPLAPPSVVRRRWQHHTPPEHSTSTNFPHESGMNNSLYHKYKEDSINARLLNDLKNHNWLINKVSKQKEQASRSASESPPKRKESLRVSLPINMEHSTANVTPRTITPSQVLASSADSERFINVCKIMKKPLPPAEEMGNEDVKFKVPKLTDARSCPEVDRAKATRNQPSVPQLRMIRHNPKPMAPLSNGGGSSQGWCTSKPPIVALTPGTNSSNAATATISTATTTSISPVVTSNVLVSNARIMDKNIPASEINTVNSAIANNVQEDTNISLKHKLPVTTIPAKATYKIVPRSDIGGAEVDKGIKVRAEASAQTDKVFIGTEDEFKMLDVITNSGLTREELKEAVDIHRKYIEKSNKAATVIIDLDKDDENNNVNQQMLNMALFHSQNNKNLLLSEMQNFDNSNTSTGERPTRANTPFPFTIPPPPPPLPPDPVSVNHVEVAKSLRHMARKIIALTNELRSPTTLTVDENTQTENSENNKNQKKQSDNTNEKDTDMEQHYNNLRSFAALPSHPTQYGPQTLLVHRNEHLKQLHHQQQYLQQLQLQQPQMQHLSPLQFLQIQADRSMYQQPHSEEHQASQNEMLYRQQQHIQYAPSTNNYRQHSKQHMTSKNTKQQQDNHAQLFPGDPRSQTMQHHSIHGNVQHRPPRVMSTYEANMRSSQANRRPNYETQLRDQQHYQNQYWQHH